MSIRTRTQPPTSEEPQEALAPPGLEAEGAQAGPSRAEGPTLAPGEALSQVGRWLEEARADSSGEPERQALAGRINEALDALARGGGSREAADVFLQLLEEGRLTGLEDAGGRACRRAAVEGLLELGFPYALEVRPEDAEALGDRSPHLGRWGDALGVALLMLGGLLAQGLLGGPGPGPPLESTPEAVWGLGVFCMVAALLASPRTPVRQVALVLGAVLAAAQLLLSLLPGYAGAVSGLAGLVAVLLLARHEGPGASTSSDVRAMD